MRRFVSILIAMATLLCVFPFAIVSSALKYNGFTYEVVNKYVNITGYSGTANQITIPAKIDSKAVKGIKDSAFKNNKTITKVVVSTGVETIGASVFENCTKLNEISLPNTVIKIGEKAIYNTAYYNNKSNWKLKRIAGDNSSGVGTSDMGPAFSWEDVIAPTLEYLYLGTALIECEYSGEYNIKEGTTVIADYAFKKSSGAKVIGLPKSLKGIGDYAFANSSKLEDVTISKSISYVGKNAFHKNVMIVGYTDTAAEKSAKENGNQFYPLNYKGLYEIYGDWYYMGKGGIDESFTGFIEHTNGKWYYVKDGAVDKSYIGLVKHTDGEWYHINKGVVVFNYTGISKYDKKWYYMQNGELNKTYTGLVKHT
ncbi:MAG: leucine-rich repeat domain-containing protein, partial [Clostridia bacterium]|nr:leucine-rich repeat domain-containing protein [Clostridia bacterium]